MAKDPKDPNDDEEILEENAEDAGLDDDEGGDEAEAGQESEDASSEEGQVEEPQSRGERRFQKLSTTAREAAAKAQALEVEVAQLRAERAQREAQAAQPKEPTPEEEAAKLALMTVEERVDYRLEKAEKRHQREIALTRFQAADMADRAAYESKAAANPRYKRYAKEVEDLLASERRAGRDFPRETVLRFVLGGKVLDGGPTRDKAAAAGKERIRGQQARADSGRSDRAAPQRGRGSGDSIEALEKRLAGQFI